ncbi:MAG: 4Fe-4S binding protein [Muribaculaceae bacterium]|nr:4Fe-4S binding protein [Muribaculaceae bacterium]
MYKSIRYLRIIIALLAMGVPTWALLAGYDSVFVRMQIFTALISGASVCLIFWLVVTLVYGRLYCSTVCPLGTLIDCTSAVSRLVRRNRSNYVYAPPATRTRIIFLIVAIASILIGTGIIPTVFDPYSAYARMVNELVARPLGLDSGAVSFTLSSLSIAALTAVAVVATGWRHGRILCNTACPVGTILAFTATRPYFHIEIDPDRCINCGECERVCKAQCIKLPEKTVNVSRCVVCFDCTAVCPNGAITYRTGSYRLDMPLMQSTSNEGGKAQTDAGCSACAKYKIKKIKDETIH